MLIVFSNNQEILWKLDPFGPIYQYLTQPLDVPPEPIA